MRKENTMEEHSTEAPLCDACRTIPVAHLSMDVPEPIEGWESFFAERNIPVVDDDLGRASVARDVLADLIAEQREREARLAERPQLEREPLPVGVPAREGLSAIETMMGQPSYTTPRVEFGGRPRPRFLEESLEDGARRQAAEREAIRRRKETQ
jgi:hypothetical protein